MYCPRRNASFACDQVNLCRPCAPFWATYIPSLSSKSTGESGFPTAPFLFLLHLLGFFSTRDRLRSGSTGEVSDCNKGPAGGGGGGGGRYCVSANGHEVSSKPTVTLGDTCAYGKPPSHPIWNVVVYRGKIKHAVICRQFEAPCPPAAPPRTNCVRHVCREERKGWRWWHGARNWTFCAVDGWV